jgi:ribosomal protein L29
MAEHLKTRAHLAQLRDASREELDAAAANAYKSIYQFRKDRFSKPQEDVKIVKNSRKEIARIKTILRERELAERQK